MLTSVESRLQDLTGENGKPLFARVESALNINDIKGRSVPVPLCCYVIDLGETPNNALNDSAGSVAIVTATVGILIGLQSRNDKSGMKGNALLQNVKKQVRTSLLGWRVAREFTNFQLGASAPLVFADNGLWWMERFTTTYYLESMYDQAN